MRSEKRIVLGVGNEIGARRTQSNCCFVVDATHDEGVDADGFATFSTPKAIDGNTEKWKPYNSLGQCWYASVGIKYFFN